jgi:amidase
MKADLPLYFQNHANKKMTFNGVQSIIDYNILDSIRAPYGQKLFQGIVEDSSTPEEFSTIKSTLKTNGKAYFDTMMKTHELDGVLSINNYHAGYAAVAEYPALTVPMGLNKENAPMGLTFITKPFQEVQLYQWGYHFEKVAKKRPLPNHYN